MLKLSVSQRAKIERALAQHDRHRNAYFWTPAASAGQRRYTERQNNWSVKFKHAGVVYEYVSDVSCSCRNYRYAGTFLCDGVERDVRLFKRLLDP